MYLKQTRVHRKSGPVTEHNEGHTKQDISEKMREIKLRQQNWMKQRTQSLAAASVESVTSLKSRGADDVVQQPSSHYNTASSSQPTVNHTSVNDRVLPTTHCRCDDALSHADDAASVRCASDLNAGRRRQERSRDAERRPRSDIDSRSRLISNHFCVNCLQLMMGEGHCPVLVSPCGHTLCEQCSGRQCYCPVCHCFIETQLSNVALHRLITQHHQHQQQQPTHSDGVTWRKDADADEDSETAAAAENVRLRCEVLCAERETLMSELRQMDTQLSDHRQQLTSIESQHSAVQRQIAELTHTVSTLSRERTESVRVCEEMMIRRTDVETRLNLLQTTLAQLRAANANTQH